MPSSLIFAALATAWLVVLVPMIAKRRQEVVRTAESALASRVLHRQNPHRAALQYGQEVPLMGERITEREYGPDERRYRPGRGGYDPEAAALAAQARYVFRQRVVLSLLVGVLGTVLLAFVTSSQFWWAHVGLDVALAGYLGYLRRQVRIEEEVRSRRAARMAGSRDRTMPATSHEDSYEQERYDQEYEQEYDEHERSERSYDEQPGYEPPREADRPAPRRAAPPPLAHPTAVALDLDDDDPMFDELNPAFRPSRRRAVGE